MDDKGGRRKRCFNPLSLQRSESTGGTRVPTATGQGFNPLSLQRSESTSPVATSMREMLVSILSRSNGARARLDDKPDIKPWLFKPSPAQTEREHKRLPIP